MPRNHDPVQLKDNVEGVKLTAAILVIGDEVLSGAIKDENIYYIARYLTSPGIDIGEIRIVPDGAPSIVEAVVPIAVPLLRRPARRVLTKLV
jgi:molybdopterin biosynthesis enzyme MoaB